MITMMRTMIPVFGPLSSMIGPGVEEGGPGLTKTETYTCLILWTDIKIDMLIFLKPYVLRNVCSHS